MKRTTLFTCSIYPDLTRVWYHFARRYTDASCVQYVIYDCGSRLRKEYFPDVLIVRYPNVDHGRKIDDCVRKVVDTPLMFLSDDDAFILSDQAEPMAARALLDDGKAAALSFKPREWWEFEIDGLRHPVMGSYSLVFKPEVIKKESLSFRTRPTDEPDIRQGSGYYDTADYANKQLLLKGYRIIVPEKDARRELVLSYSAVSSAFLNFARRRWLSRDYHLTKPLDLQAQDFRSDTRKLEWACGVSATISLYRTLFRERPRFEDFFNYDDLEELVESIQEPSAREKAISLVKGYRCLLTTLEEAA
ncbi:MAG: hypothetical protein AB1631_33650 [Acidobacteriota bacterium]